MRKDYFYSRNWRKCVVKESQSLRDALQAINESGVLLSCLVSSDNVLRGIVTDSDLRQALLQGASLEDLAFKWCQKSPVTANIGTSRQELVNITKQMGVREIPIIDDLGRVCDIFIFGKQLYVEAPREALPNSMVIFAGGLGTRLRSVVSDRPKPLAKIGNRPILATLLERAIASRIENFVVIVNYLADHLIDFLKSSEYKNYNFTIVKEEERLGTAGGLSLIKELPKHPMLVSNADVLTTVPFSKLIEHHNTVDADITCTVRSHTLSVPYGVVELDDTSHLVDIKEKPDYSYLVNAGIYVMNPSVVESVPYNQHLDMTDLIRNLLKDNRKISPFLLHEYWIDIGNPDDYSKANQEFEEHFESKAK